MGSAATIPLMIQPPQVASPLSSIGALMNLRGQMSEIALRSAQVEQAKQTTQNIQAEQTQKNRDIADQNQLQELEKDPDSYAKILAGDLSPLAGKVQDKTLQAVRTNINTALQNEATRSKEQLSLRGEAAGTIGKDMGTALQTQRLPDGSLDVAKVNTLLPQFVAAHAAELKALGIDPATLPNSVADEDHLNLLAARVNAFGAMTTAAQELKSKQATAAEATGKGAQAQAAAGLDAEKLRLLKGGTANDATAGALMDKLFAGKPDLRAQADAIYAAGKAAKPLEPGAGVDAVKGFYDEQVSKPNAAVTTQANLLPGEVKKAAQVEAATAPAKVAEQVAAARAMRAGDNAAVAGVAPGSIPQVQEHAIKLDQEYAGAKEATDAMDKLIALATGGNKAAGANLPLAGVGAVNAINGIKRINSAEIAQYGTAGSLLDGIKGKLGKWTEGKPIPVDVLADIKTLHDTLGAQSYQKYSGELDSLNKRTGASYQPTYPPPGGAILPKGAGAVIDKATARKFYDAAGGDPAKARTLAEQNGWKVQ